MPIPQPEQLVTVEYYLYGTLTRTTTRVEIARVGETQLVVRTEQGWPFVIDLDNLLSVADTDPEIALNAWCPTTHRIDCKDQTCILHGVPSIHPPRDIIL